MARGLSQSAERARRRRFLNRVKRLAMRAGLVFTEEQGMVTVLLPKRKQTTSAQFRMEFSHDSTGVTYTIRRLAVRQHYRDFTLSQLYTDWLWLEENAAVADFWRMFDKGAGRFDASLIPEF